MISGFVISYNREALIHTCLRSIRFVDELILVDKSSTDRTPDIGAKIADRVVRVDWSPTVEETRAFALAQCQGDFIVFLDDDEILSPEAINFLRHEARGPSYDLYDLLCRHHVLGRHDERCYYWPQWHIRAFRRGTFEFLPKVHGGAKRLSYKIWQAPIESNICFHNVSHADVATWIEKANRYTSQPDRAYSIAVETGMSLVAAAKQNLEEWTSKVMGGAPWHVEATAILRSIYDIVDMLKQAEQSEMIDGRECFRRFCKNMELEYDKASDGVARFDRNWK